MRSHLLLLALLTSSLLLGAVACGDSSPAPQSSSDARAEGDASGLDALAAALDSPDPYLRAEKLGQLIPTLGPEAVPDVQEILKNFRKHLGAVEFELLLRFWASHEPRKATLWVFRDGPPLYQVTAARTAVETWAEADPTAAITAIQESQRWSADVVQITQMALITGWYANGDHESLERYIQGLGYGITRQRALYAYFLAKASAEGGEALIDWAAAFPDDDERYKLQVFRQVLAALTWSDAEAAKRFCELHCSGPWGKGLRAVLVRSRLNQGEYGGDVVEWVGGIEPRNETERENLSHALFVAYSIWATREPEEAIAWMEEKLDDPAPPPWLDRLYGEYARLLAADSVELALEWAQRIPDEPERRHTQMRIAKYWYRIDPEAAEAWLVESPLDERERNQARQTTTLHHLPRISQELGGAVRGPAPDA